MGLVTLSPYNASALVLRQVSCSRRHIESGKLITGAGRPVVRVVFTAKVSDLSNLRVVPARSRHHSPEETQHGAQKRVR